MWAEHTLLLNVATMSSARVSALALRRLYVSYMTVPEKWRMANVEEEPAGGMNLGREGGWERVREEERGR